MSQLETQFQRCQDSSMSFTTEEILGLVGIGVVLAVVVTAYMVISRRSGWM